MKDNKKEFIRKIKEKIKLEIKKRGLQNLSDILKELKDEYAMGITKFGVKDVEQSWKPFKGSLLEDIIIESIVDNIEKLDFTPVKGKELERNENQLSECLAKAKRSLVVDYGEFGMHLPDADIIIIDKKDCKVVAIISSKTTLRERVAQTAYWFLKLKSSTITKNIKVYFITLDEDGDLKLKFPTKKGRAIAETDTDGTFVITFQDFEESEKVKKFDKFLLEIQKLNSLK